jgi:sugar-specific transcriptional regulator TrmB
VFVKTRKQIKAKMRDLDRNLKELKAAAPADTKHWATLEVAKTTVRAMKETLVWVMDNAQKEVIDHEEDENGYSQQQG